MNDSRDTTPPEIHGHYDERLEPLAAWFRSNQEQGVDEGASLAVCRGDEILLDLWAGTTDYRRTVPWERDTLVNVFSTGKVITAITTLLLYDRGELDLDAPIAEVWPEFAAHGKDAITTRHVLTHTSGVPGFGRSIASNEIEDWDLIIGILEQVEPWHAPGVESIYHLQTQGFLLGEVVRRVSGRTFGEFFRSELGEPLDADFHFGITDSSDLARVARLWYPEAEPDAFEHPINLEVERGDWATPARLAAVIPSAGGVGNGRSIARLGALVASLGVLDGRRYFSEATVAEMTREQSFLEDRMLGPLRMGLGVALHSGYFPAPTPTTVHWGGYGGSGIAMDPATGLSFGYAPNKLLLDSDPEGTAFSHGRLTSMIHAIRESAHAFD